MTSLTSLKRTLGAAGAAVLLAASLSACGGAPTDASKSDFCDVVNSEPEGLNSDDADKAADAAHDYADELNEVGTPESIDGDAREGFELFTDFLADVNGDDIEEFTKSENPDDVFDKDDQKKIEAFFKEASETCAA